MKYCTKCGYQLVDEARFCNACGYPVEVIKAEPVAHVNPENPYASVVTSAAPQHITEPVSIPQSAPQYTNEPKTDEDLRAEEQALLDKFSLGLKHERMAWKFTGIFYLIGAIFFVVAGLFFGIAALAIGDSSGDAFGIGLAGFIMYTFMGLFYLPITIINLAMKKKLENYRAKLYIDCKDGIGHFSVGSIIFAAFFNTIAMVFIIIYFIKAKNNAPVIERIKAQQDSYNSQM